MYLGEHRARMRAWRQGEVHLLVKEQVVIVTIATTIILSICINMVDIYLIRSAQ